MSADFDAATNPCGCVGCTDERVAVIDHPEYGRRVVCKSHVNGYPIIERIGSGAIEAYGGP